MFVKSNDGNKFRPFRRFIQPIGGLGAWLRRCAVNSNEGVLNSTLRVGERSSLTIFAASAIVLGS